LICSLDLTIPFRGVVTGRDCGVGGEPQVVVEASVDAPSHGQALLLVIELGGADLDPSAILHRPHPLRPVTFKG